MKDRFSNHASQYAQFRPGYPPELFDFIYHHVTEFDIAWDCATGNGQAARVLANRFKNVFATDISAKQIENAFKNENIFYSLGSEKSSLKSSSVNLITVAQAAHWLDMKTFSIEAKRVLKPDGILALWGYGLVTINETVDPLIKDFYKNIVGAYWDPERIHIDEHYKNLYFPFHEIGAPSFKINLYWTLDELRGYLNTWSAVQ